MKSNVISCLALGVSMLIPLLHAEASAHPVSVVAAARGQIGKTMGYEPAYQVLDYPNGDVPIEVGVCTDVVVRALRTSLAMDLQKLVHEDMRRNFARYPQNWGLRGPDKNIDHRRVPNIGRVSYVTCQTVSRPVSAWWKWRPARRCLCRGWRVRVCRLRYRMVKVTSKCAIRHIWRRWSIMVWWRCALSIMPVR